MKTLTIIDTFGFFFRLYYAMSNLRSKSGKPSGMVSGFASFIANLNNEFKSDYIIFALDSKGITKRHEIAPEYKANRQEAPNELKEQLPICIKMIKDMGLCAISKDGYEADDIIASVVKLAKKQNIFVRVVTHDKDLYQLIEDNKVSLYGPQSQTEYNEQACVEKYGVKPSQIRDFLALVGDSSDNIPGVKGIGAKGAKKLLDEFGSVEGIYDNLAFISNERTKNMLVEGRQSAFLSKKLATLFDDAIDDLVLEKAEFPLQNPLIKVADTLREYDLNRILKSIQISENLTPSEIGFDAKLILDVGELERILNGIDNNTIVAFDTETTGLESNSSLVGFSFCFNESEAYYVPVAHSYLGVPEQVDIDTAKWAINQIYKGYVIGQNLKYDFEIIKNNFDINPPLNFADTMIMAWLENPELSAGMDSLAKRLFNYDTIKFESIVKKGETFANVELEQACKYAAEDAWITLRFYYALKQILPKELFDLANTLEFKFVNVLIHMQSAGIALNRIALRTMIEKNDLLLKELRDVIYNLSGENFNINSVKQLGEILFEKLKLPAKKKTKTGYSTDEAVLSELVNHHPVIEKLLDYRELYKLQSTYCEPLLNLALKDKEDRVHTSFLQTGTATGRLSSKNPNLQNIPARSDRAKQIRSVFVPKRGFSFVGLDYSQIELRLLAHFSEDAALLEAFKNDEDIHATTAVSIFGSSNEQNRAVAKSINFGLIYGMGSAKLANQLGISRNEAKEYIERYFLAFPSIKGFLESLKVKARELGYCTTLLNRRRYFDFVNATPMQLAMYEREAVNTKFQGSAADIIKLAMLKIHDELLSKDAKMLLQIHDELIFEVADEIAGDFANRVQNIMQNIYELKVPLKTSLSIAKNWGDLK